MTSDRELRVVIGPRPQLPLVLAAPLLMIVVGVAMATFKFAERNFGELVSFVVVPYLVWRFWAGGRYRAGRTVRAMVVLLGSCVVAIAAFETYAWSERGRQAVIARDNAKAAAARAAVRKAGTVGA